MPLRPHNPFEDRHLRLNAQHNPYVQRLTEAQQAGDLPVKIGSALAGLKGNWKNSFGQSESLIVEVGCHLGHTITAMASAHPEYQFVGLDITFKRVFATAKKAKNQNLSNVTAVLANARCLEDIFAPEEVDGFILFFPDPWMKKARQAKHRLFSPEFGASLERVLKPGGFFWMKTDQKPYLDEVAAILVSSSLNRELPREPLTQETYTTLFEQGFRNQGLSTYEAFWVKNLPKFPS